MGYISTILTINAPKWRQSAGTWKFSSNATFSSTEAPLDNTWQIVRKSNKLKKVNI